MELFVKYNNKAVVNYKLRKLRKQQCLNVVTGMTGLSSKKIKIQNAYIF